MSYQYYLDTNAVQSLGPKLESIPTDNVFTSIWTQIELVSAIEDEGGFRRKRAALKHLQQSGLFVDQTLAALKLYMAFGAIERTIYTCDDFSKQILPVVMQAQDYEDLIYQLDKLDLIEKIGTLKVMDELSSGMNYFIENNKWPIIDYDKKWSGNKNVLLNESIDYHAGCIQKRTGIPKEISKIRYDHSIDYYMLIDYYYVEQKKHSHDKSARNDMNDIFHLLYLKKGNKLVTDDKGFQKYVNKMVYGLAIGTEQFMEEINK